MRETYLRTLGLDLQSTEDDIKKRYKEIVLKTHPDKVMNMPELTDEERQSKDKEFKEATEAYRKLMDKDAMKLDDLLGSFGSFGNFEFGYSDKGDMDNISKMMAGLGIGINMDSDIGDIGSMEDIMAGFGMDEGMSKNIGKIFDTYKNMTTQYKTKVYITYDDLLNKRKLNKDISLYGMTEKVMIDCSSFPRQKLMRKTMGMKMMIVIDMDFYDDDSNVFEHRIRKDGCVDLIYNIGVNHYQFYKGIQGTVEHVDGSIVHFKTKKGDSKRILIEDKGLNGGDMFVEITVINPKNKNVLKEITKEEYKTLLNILGKLR